VSISNVRIIVNLCMSDLFDRYPRLQVVSAESGIGWIPFILESMEFQLDEMVTDPDEVVLQSRGPTEYFRDHIYVIFWFETYAAQTMLDHIGVQRILVETDLPHPTCLYPSPRKHFAKVLSSVPRDTRRRILRDNAVELYHLDVP
jgi:predicted TIM-barrel fold metal-dependent hydrolase